MDEIKEHIPDSMEKFFLTTSTELSKLYEAIISGEYTFPEFATLSKKKKKEYSLKAHSILLRMFRIWETQAIGEDETNAKDIGQAS